MSCTRMDQTTGRIEQTCGSSNITEIFFQKYTGHDISSTEAIKQLPRGTM